MIDGLKVTMTGEELRRVLAQRIARHQARADRWISETQRTKEDETDDAPLLPEHICEHEAERHTWRAEVLTFIRDHVDASETYRLCADDLEYGELLPEQPGSVKHAEYEDRTRLAFNLERLVKTVDRLGWAIPSAMERRVDPTYADAAELRETVIDDTDEFRTTRIDVEGGPEILKIERK